MAWSSFLFAVFLLSIALAEATVNANANADKIANKNADEISTAGKTGNANAIGNTNALLDVAAIDTDNAANPIRKVVSLLQKMQQKVEAEGKLQQELYDKFMCYCKGGTSALETNIETAKNRIPAVKSAVEEAISGKAQLQADLKQHQADRADAKDATAKAEAIRKKEAAAFAKEKGELEANTAALSRAIDAVKRGQAGGFLQTVSASQIRKVCLSVDMSDNDRQTLMGFLSGSTGYSPRSGEISGILETLKDDMDKELDDAAANEKSAIEEFEGLKTAKGKEVQSLSKAIESKSARIGELAVQIAQGKNDLADTEQALGEDSTFLRDIKKDCETKDEEWAETSRLRQEEMLALADTIKILNDDDALELFKKTLPSAAGSLVQLGGRQNAIRQRAVTALNQVRRRSKLDLGFNPDLDFIVLAIQGKKVGLEKVLQMLDSLVANMKKEQVDDDKQKEYCNSQLDEAEAKNKALGQAISDHEVAITDAEEAEATLKDEIAKLEEGIVALDKSVAEATEQRKEEHDDSTTLMASNNAAKQILAFAKKRLNKFYNPTQYEPAPKEELLQVVAEPTLLQITTHRHKSSDEPAPAPDAPGAYKRKGEEGSGVIAMIDRLVADVEKETTEADVSEKDAQESYEEMMADSAKKRAVDSQAITEKKAALAAAEEDVETRTESKKASGLDLMAAEKYLGSLHAECDWLLKYYTIRKNAREGEIDALGKAKAVLGGANFGLVQTGKAATTSVGK